MSGGSVLVLPKAGVQALHQDPQAIVLPQLKTGTGVIARYQAVASVYWILHSEVQDHVPETSLVYGFERRPNPYCPGLRRMGQGLGSYPGGIVARSEVGLLPCCIF